MRNIFLLIFLISMISCKRENDTAKSSLNAGAVQEIYAIALEKSLAEQRENKSDPELKEYYDLYARADYDAAFKSVELVALAGHSQAQAELATLYLQGKGIPVNINTAIVWLNRSREQGNMMANATLGEIYFAANHGRPDYGKSYLHYEVCAMQLRLPCIAPFAMLHVTQGSGHYDPVKAAAWLEIGVDQNAPGSVRERDALVPQLSEEEVAQILPTKLALLESIATQLKRK